MASHYRKTSPKPDQIDKSSQINDNILSTAEVENLQDELNYLRSIIKQLKGTSNYDDSVSVTLLEAQTGYTHTQTLSSSEWTIFHGLNKTPNVIIFDDQSNQIFADIKFLSEDAVQITFSEPLTGTAFLN